MQNLALDCPISAHSHIRYVRFPLQCRGNPARSKFAFVQSMQESEQYSGSCDAEHHCFLSFAHFPRHETARYMKLCVMKNIASVPILAALQAFHVINAEQVSLELKSAQIRKRRYRLMKDWYGGAL